MSAVSKYFSVFLHSDLNVSKRGDTIFADLTQFSSRSVRHFIELIYKQRTFQEEKLDLLEFLRLASYLQCNDLVSLALQTVINGLTVENCVQRFEAGKAYFIKELCTISSSFICANIKEVSALECFADISADFLIEILNDKMLSINSVTLVHAESRLFVRSFLRSSVCDTIYQHPHIRIF